MLDEPSSSEPSDSNAPVLPSNSGAVRTSTGVMVGTVAYMAPEQAHADPASIGPHTDVYSLGLLLGEILVGRSINARRSIAAIWRELAEGRVPELPVGVGPPTPPDLAGIYARSVAFAPSSRYPHGGAFARALRAWLDGEAKRAEAARMVAEVDTRLESLSRLRGRAAKLRAQAQRMLADVPREAEEEEKIPGWQLEDAASLAEEELTRSESELVEELRAALQHDPDHAPAHRRLAQLYRQRLEECELTGDLRGALRAEMGLRRHDRGEHASFLEGLATLTLASDPPGAQVRAAEFQVVDRKLVPVESKRLGRTPVEYVKLPRGSYLLELRHAACEPVRYPIRLGREEAWDARPPGAAVAEPVWLPPLGSLEADEVYVPAGWYGFGGDPAALEGHDAVRVWVGGYVMERHPVTYRSYMDFLDALIRSGARTEAQERVPRKSGGEDARLIELSDDGCKLSQGPFFDALSEQAPVSFVRLEDAWAYARWRSEREGKPWRLPMEAEWEKAARGVDGRPYVWGHHFDLSWANVGGTRHPPTLEEVTVDRRDLSVYGVRGLAGNIRQWCADRFVREDAHKDGDAVVVLCEQSEADLVSIRGSTYATTTAPARVCTRLAGNPNERFYGVGIRLVRSLPESEPPRRSSRPSRGPASGS